MENLVIALFCLILFGCIFMDVPLLLALFAGFLLFVAYGLYKKYSLGAVLKMALAGINNVKTIFLVFLLIGMLTGLWRASGTIAYIISLATQFIRPSIFLLLAFLLNCAISFLLGTSFGTAATMGVITMSIGNTLGVPALYTGGAILSGVYFGDRMSPVSTSALLVSVLTETDLYTNIRNMALDTLPPFLAASLIYLGVGLSLPVDQTLLAQNNALESLYQFSPILVLPALSILVLSFFHVNVKKNMGVSIILAFILCVAVQGSAPGELLSIMLFGFHVQDPVLAPMVNGGGIVSMLRVGAIVCLSSSFAGIFQGTGLLDGVHAVLERLSQKTGYFVPTLLSAIFTALISCNQTLSIILTSQLCGSLTDNKNQFAISLEDTAVVISPLIPWSIACATVLDTTGSPRESILFACYLILVPLWARLKSFRHPASA